MRRCFKFQPLSLIRSYMGEKVTFYFALSGFYNQMLILPALVGLIIFIYGISSVFSDQPTYVPMAHCIRFDFSLICLVRTYVERMDTVH